MCFVNILNWINLDLPLYLQAFQAAEVVLFWSAHPKHQKTLPELTSSAHTGQPFFLQLSHYGLITLSVALQPDQNGPWEALSKRNAQTQLLQINITTCCTIERYFLVWLACFRACFCFFPCICLQKLQTGYYIFSVVNMAEKAYNPPKPPTMILQKPPCRLVYCRSF